MSKHSRRWVAAAHCPFLHLSVSFLSRASRPILPPYPSPDRSAPPFRAARRAHGASGAFISTQALLALALAVLLLRSYISRQAAGGQAWAALFPWGCALFASQAGVAPRLVVGRAGEVAIREGARQVAIGEGARQVAIGEGSGGWVDSAAALGTVDSEAAGAGASDAVARRVDAGEAAGAGRVAEQQGPWLKAATAGAAEADGSISTVDASDGSTSAGSNSSGAGGPSEAAEQAEQAACECAALSEEDVRAWQAEEHTSRGAEVLRAVWEERRGYVWPVWGLCVASGGCVWPVGAMVGDWEGDLMSLCGGDALISSPPLPAFSTIPAALCVRRAVLDANERPFDNGCR
ncbi:unnamed protein product [Closterium sp. Yama58-4]|nr:unnamed protein product [Closterium sp. Yama58-4]